MLVADGIFVLVKQFSGLISSLFILHISFPLKFSLHLRARGGSVHDFNGDEYEYQPFPSANQENDGGVLALSYPGQHLKHVLGVTKNNFDECDVLRHTNGKKITDG